MAIPTCACNAVAISWCSRYILPRRPCRLPARVTPSPPPSTPGCRAIGPSAIAGPSRAGCRPAIRPKPAGAAAVIRLTPIHCRLCSAPIAGRSRVPSRAASCRAFLPAQRRAQENIWSIASCIITSAPIASRAATSRRTSAACRIAAAANNVSICCGSGCWPKLGARRRMSARAAGGNRGCRGRSIAWRAVANFIY